MPARARRARISAAASAPSAVLVSTVASSQDSGRKSRQLTAADAQSVAACTLTPIWQFPVLPSAPQYIRATPGELAPSLGNPVSSSTINARGSTNSAAQPASRRRTST
jgi:hypothetical protein